MAAGKTVTTTSEILVKRVYTPKDLEEIGFQYDRDLGEPGQYPYTRGIDPEMYRQDLWVMGQYAGFGSAEEANERYKFILAQGGTGFSIALDLPTQIGLDSDHPLARGEVGKIGVAIDSLRDMEIIFDGIPLDRVRHIRTSACSIGPLALAWFLAVMEQQGVSPQRCSIILQNDVLKEYPVRGTQIFSPQPALKFAVDTIEYCARELPGWQPLMVSGYHFRDAGANAVQEIAFTYANAIAYIEETLKRGVPIDQIAPTIRLHFCASMELFEEIAKLRAGRRMWANLVKERFKAQDPRSWIFRHHSGTLGGNLTAQQPFNNIVRVTIEALSAILGGSQSLRTSSMDEAYAIPTEEAEKLAIRTQQIIAYESGITKTVDPLGGSYFIESLTSKIEEEANRYLQRIENMGGAIPAIESGFIQHEIDENAYRVQKEIEKGKRIIVGLNKFETQEKVAIKTFRSNPQTAIRQVERLNKIKAERDAAKVHSALAEVKRAAASDENLVLPILKAVKTYATIGEICDQLREVWGEYRPEAIRF
ncbi:MAG: methylmalonyl-CoA mutase [Proteobacteria bacterium]|nr:methylmalonyl-CoA mutase [Pseudomonadota bacterium]